MANSILGNRRSVGAGFLVDALTCDDHSSQRFHISASRIVEGRARIGRIRRTDACNLLTRVGHRVGWLYKAPQPKERERKKNIFLKSSAIFLLSLQRSLRCMWCRCQFQRPTDRDSVFCFPPSCSCENIILGPTRQRPNPEKGRAWTPETWDGVCGRRGRRHKFSRWRWDTKVHAIWWWFECDRSVLITAVIRRRVDYVEMYNLILLISIPIPGPE